MKCPLDLEGRREEQPYLLKIKRVTLSFEGVSTLHCSIVIVLRQHVIHLLRKPLTVVIPRMESNMT
jgi:hypothetical protein